LIGKMFFGHRLYDTMREGRQATRGKGEDLVSEVGARELFLEKFNEEQFFLSREPSTFGWRPRGGILRTIVWSNRGGCQARWKKIAPK
jgi:hypothetical protein